MAGFRRVQSFGGGRPVIFLHGWSAHGGFFAAQQPLAGHGLNLVMSDLPGHGPEALADAGLTIADLSAALAEDFAVRKPDRPVLVGWSMGASVAFDYLSRPDAVPVAGLVIIDMTPKVANDASWRLGLASGQSAADMIRAADEMERNWPAFTPRIAKALFARGSTPDPAALTLANEAFAANDSATMASLWRSLAVADYRDLLARLSIPVLAILGEKSRLYAPDLAEWYQTQHGVSVARIAEAGHAPQIEQPARFNARLMDFLATLG